MAAGRKSKCFLTRDVISSSETPLEVPLVSTMMETGSAAYRTERDIVGTLAVPVEAYYGVHTLRAMQNFPITGQRLLPEMIESIALIKKAAALTSRNEGALAPRIADAIAAVCPFVAK